MEDIINLNILGQSLAVKSHDGEEAVRKVASCLEEKIEQVRKDTGISDTLRLLLCTALQVAEENLRVKGELSRLEEEVESASARMIGMID